MCHKTCLLHRHVSILLFHLFLVLRFLLLLLAKNLINVLFIYIYLSVYYILIYYRFIYLYSILINHNDNNVCQNSENSHVGKRNYVLYKVDVWCFFDTDIFFSTCNGNPSVTLISADAYCKAVKSQDQKKLSPVVCFIFIIVNVFDFILFCTLSSCTVCNSDFVLYYI